MSLSEQANSPEEKHTVSRGMPQVKWAAYVMLCPNVRGCGAVGHYVCDMYGCQCYSVCKLRR